MPVSVHFNEKDRPVCPSFDTCLMLAPFVYSDSERHATVMWLELLCSLNAIRFADELDDQAMKIAIGRMVTALTAGYIVSKSKGGVGIKDHQWQHRGPELEPGKWRNAIYTRLSEQSALIAETAKVGIKAMHNAPQGNLEHPAFLPIRNKMGVLVTQTIHDTESPEYGLYALAAMHKFSLRECVEEFAVSRMDVLSTNLKKYGTLKRISK